MKDSFDFANAIKNPFAGREKGKYVVIVHYDSDDNDSYSEELHREKSEVRYTISNVAVAK